jgi:glycosyltransferase involved in cell wall biosynthesis
MRKRALIAAHAPPRPDGDGASRRVLDHVEILCEAGWSVSLLAAKPLRDLRSARALEERGVVIYGDSALWLDHLLSTGPLDLSLFAAWQIAELYAPEIRSRAPSARILVDSPQLELLRDARRSFVKLRPHATGSRLDAEYGSAAAGELNVYAASDAVLAASDKEAALIGDLLGDGALPHTVPHAADPRSGPGFEDREGILFVGSFRNSPNTLAVEHLCREVLPRIEPALLADHPLYIVGEGLDRAVIGYGRALPNVRMVGWVPSLAPYLDKARVSVAPMLFGAGTQRKVIEALIAGLPVVSTTLGAEGLNVRSGEHLLVADDPESFASCIGRLLCDRGLWSRLSAQARDHLAPRCSRAAVRERLLQAIDAALARQPKPPLITAPDRELYERRETYSENQRAIVRIREWVRPLLPQTSTVLVVSDGSSELLKLDPQQGWHFPQRAGGAHASYYAHDSAALIEHLEELREKGADYLLFPTRQQWWLRYYPEFREYLQDHYEAVTDDEYCLLFDLRAKRAPMEGVLAVTASGRGGRDPVAANDRDHPAKLIAFYLPQFHPIPENDEWWGDGFTEWANVGKAQPLFPGHEQPRLPADLGFYDLRLPEARQAQADLAREYGVHAFCYYHYWFHGKRLLHRPFDEVLATGEPDFPFCLCWANEPWSRRWDGTSRDVLQSQSYSEEDDLNHIAWLLPALCDPRAVTVEGRPIFLVYNARGLPDPARTADTWRREVRRAGGPGICLIALETSWDAGWDATKAGFDAKALFQPQFSRLNSVPRLDVGGPSNLRVWDYDQVWPWMANTDPVSYRCYGGVCPGWDNTPRAKENGVVLHRSTPVAYERWLSVAIARIQDQPADHRLVFVNAWNEWAEGCHLEPDLRHGRRYLEATRNALLAAAPDVRGPDRGKGSAGRLIGSGV